MPVWSDEAGTSRIVQQTLPQMIKTVETRDIHPPLFYLLLHVWPWHQMAGLRAFSALWAVIAVLLLDQLWTKNWRPRHRALALSLFAFSPCLLLYGRMARSYSMQTALTIAAVGFLWRWLRTGKGAVAAGTCILALLYTHYVPGLAVLIAFTAVAWPRLGARRIIYFVLGVGCGYLPWLLTFSSAIREWLHPTHFSSQYRITGSALIEPLLKIGYAAASLTIGESFHPASLLLVPFILIAIFAGARRASRPLIAMLAIAGVIGYIAVSQWVSYPFVPARVLWMLPFLSLAAAIGLGRNNRATHILITLIVVSFATSIFLYFDQSDFLNRGYIAPLREIAGQLNQHATPSDLVLVDAYNADGEGLKYYLHDPSQAIELYALNEPAVSAQLGHARTVWLIRNPRDISPGHVTTRIEQQACASSERTESDYLPFEPWQKALLAVFMKQPVAYFYELVRCAPLQ